jgi:hypothetical protein
MTKSAFHCHLCRPGASEVGLITPHLAVVLHEGTYLLVEANGGCGEVLVRFTATPYPDPVTPEIEARLDLALDDEENLPEDDAALDKSFLWLEQASKEMAPLAAVGQDLRHAWRIVQDLMVHTGYDVELCGSVETCLYDLIGQTVAAGHSVTGLDDFAYPASR